PRRRPRPRRRAGRDSAPPCTRAPRARRSARKLLRASSRSSYLIKPSTSAISFVIGVVVLDPAGIATAARRVHMSAVNAVAQPRIDVERAVDHDTASFKHRDALWEVGVVIHLEDLARLG